MELVPLPWRQELVHQGYPMQSVYFPESGVVSIVVATNAVAVLLRRLSREAPALNVGPMLVSSKEVHRKASKSACGRASWSVGRVSELAVSARWLKGVRGGCFRNAGSGMVRARLATDGELQGAVNANRS